MLKRILVVTLMTGMLAMLAGCNTMAGLGQDIERAGEKLKDKASR